MNEYYAIYSENDYRLYHHGILGQKWGVRRYQNADGTLTEAGKKRYGDSNKTTQANRADKGKLNLSDKQKKALKVGAVALGSALAVYGAYKLNKVILNDVDTKNLTLATLAGNNFANRFIDNDVRPIHGVGAMANNRYANAIRIGNEARGPLASRIGENVYKNRGSQFSQLKRARQLKDVTSGKKTLDDILSYSEYTKMALDDTKWDQQGQEWLARALRDLNNFSGGGVYNFRHS